MSSRQLAINCLARLSRPLNLNRRRQRHMNFRTVDILLHFTLGTLYIHPTQGILLATTSLLFSNVGLFDTSRSPSSPDQYFFSSFCFFLAVLFLSLRCVLV
ncbi:hypothetical protein GGR54DRAFT_620479, partial [Hypoxylon sp. NC1633]